MHTHGIRGVLFGLCIVLAATAAENASTPVAEVKLSEAFLQQFQFSGRKTAPFMKKGHEMHPDLTLLAAPRLRGGANSAEVSLDVSLFGWSTTDSQRKILGRTIDVRVQSNINANYTQPLSFSGQGLKALPVSGYPTITPDITTKNDFRKPRRNEKVNRKAFGVANAAVQERLPEEREELHDEITQSVNKSVGQARHMVDTGLAQASGLMANAKAFPFDAAFSSEGGAGGAMHLKLVDKAGVKKTRSPQPVLEREAQAASTVSVHADLLADTISPEIAGKEMFFSDLKNVLCGPKTKNLLDFCKTEMPEDRKGMSVVFAKEKPIEFFFEKGKIGIRLNALYRTTDPKALPAGRDLLNAPERGGVGFQTVPYSIDLSYRLKEGGAVLDTLAVRDKASPLGGLFRAATGAIFGRGNHEGPDGKKEEVPSALAETLSPVIRGQIEAAVRGSMRETIVFPTVSFPTKLTMDNFGSNNGASPTVSEAASLVPLEAKAESGWLVVANAYCSDGMPSLGVTVDEVATRGGGPKALQVHTFYPGSPAALTGFKSGDVIESFGEPGERATTALEGKRDAFLDFVAGRSLGANPGDRLLEITGRDALGKPFKRSVSVCPSQLKHRELAAQTLAAAKKAAAH